MDPPCQICGDQTDVRRLETACHSETPRTVAVCQGCLDLRDAKRWSTDTAEGRRLKGTLASGRPQHPQGRYTYLLDPSGDLHLVRLQRAWLAQHSTPA